MNTTRKLKTTARALAAYRGHDLNKFKTVANGKHFDAECIDCGMEVRITPKPLPNEIDVCGNAIAVNCPNSKWFHA